MCPAFEVNLWLGFWLWAWFVIYDEICILTSRKDSGQKRSIAVCHWESGNKSARAPRLREDREGAVTGHSGVSPGSAPLRYRLLQVCFKTIVFYELNCDPKSPGALVTPMSSPWLAFQQYLGAQAILFHTDIPDSQSNFEGFSYIGIWSL